MDWFLYDRDLHHERVKQGPLKGIHELTTRNRQSFFLQRREYALNGTKKELFQK